MPLSWHPELALNQAMWDRNKPCPLSTLKLEETDIESERENDSQKYRQYLPWDVVKKYLKDGKIDENDWLWQNQGEDCP
jgi:CRISPR-associated protein Cmr3